MNNHITKRLFSLLLCLCMALMLMPTVALADDPYLYDLWVNNQRITSSHLTVQCGAGTAVYDPAQNTLTLNNAEITTGCTQDYLNSGIISYLPDLEIILVGENNSITNTGGEGISTYQTDADYKCIRHDLTISGGGKLTIAENTPYYGYGIYCTGDLTLNDVTLDIDSAATGLWTQWRLDITDCDIEIDVNSGFYGMLTGVGGSAPDTDKASGDGIITITNSIIDIDSTMSGAAPGAVTDSAILVDGADAVGALVVNSGSLKLRSSGNVIQGGVDTSDPADNIPDLFGVITINGGTVDMATSGTSVQSVTVPTANITLNNGAAIVRGALDGTNCFISQKYAVTVNSSYADPTGAGSYPQGATVTINAGTRNNYAFTGWTVDSGGVTLQNANNATTTFEMPANAVTVTAGWSYNGGSGGGNDYSHTPTVAVYNAQSTIWLTGSDLSAGDQLITQPLTSGSDYNALLHLANNEDVIGAYSITLRSGKASTGSAMHLHFGLASSYAGQRFTLIHKKADGTIEYFYATADSKGDLSFGPLKELSPFILVKGTLTQVPVVPLTEVPKTGDTSTPAGRIMLAAAALALITVWLRKRDENSIC